MKVKGPHGPIHGRGHDDVAGGGEGHTGDPARVLRKSDEAEATEGIPHLDLRWGAREEWWAQAGTPHIHGSHVGTQVWGGRLPVSLTP